MSSTTHTSDSTLQSLLEDAVEQYQTKVGASLIEHQLAIRLRSCDTIESINEVLEEQVQGFPKSLGNDRHSKMMKSILRTVQVLHTVFTGSGTVLGGLEGAIQAGHGVASVSIPPVKLIFSAIGILLAAVKDVNASYDLLFELFESLGDFIQRLDIYIQASPPMAVRRVAVKIIVEMLSTLALATEQIKQARLKKFGLKLFGENKVEEALKKLDKLIQEEVRATAAETLGVVSRLEQNTRVITDSETSHAEKEKADQLRRDLQHWLSPPDPWKNHNMACAARHDGTTTWLTQSDTLVNWQLFGSLLWVRGKPGAGKTIMCSSIIEYIDGMRKCGSASLAFFYCEFGDDEKNNLRGLLSSLLFQLHDQSQSYSEILSKLYSDHRNGSQEPSDAALAKCLNDIFLCAAHPPIYVIVDALDEIPKAYGIPSPRGKVLKLVEELVCLHLPNLRICVTSRPEIDIGSVLDRLKSHFFSLHEEGGQRQDIEAYIGSVVDSDLVMGTWGEEEKTLVTRALLQKGDGMFKWVSCQFDFLRRYPPERIRVALEELPDTLDGTYERSLRDIDEENWDYAHRLFQCMAVASRPFSINELAEFLAFDFEVGQVPKLVEDRRRKDPMQAVLTTCSSLITIVQEPRWSGRSDSKLIQFSHFSVKEFLMSGRLAAVRMPTIRRYSIRTTPAHTMVAKACLNTLLQLDEKDNNDSLKKLPLAEYAVRHWVDHTLFKNVSATVQEGMKRLFDPTTQHFKAWKNIDLHPFQGIQLPLHLAAFYGLRDITEFLIVQRAQNVNARQSDNRTPLSIASERGNGTITRFLLQHGADTNPRDNNSCIPLNLASSRGHLEVVQILLSHGADLNSRDNTGSTPLHSASVRNHWEVAMALLEYGADASVHDQNSQMPLHLASKNGYLKVAQLLLDHGADANALDENALTALHLVFLESPRSSTLAKKERSDLAKVLIKYGASVNSQDTYNWTPLHFASGFGYVDGAQLLLNHGADANALDINHVTPLHLASQYGHLEIVQLLLLRGANQDSRDENSRTALHLVFEEPGSILKEKERSDLAIFLIECGANVNSQDTNNWTPLHFASGFGYIDGARLLLNHGADANALDNNHMTPLHLASQYGHLEIVQLLLDRGADENACDKYGDTPLHLASGTGHPEVARLLLDRGADQNVCDNNGDTPLHFASGSGHPEVTRLLLDRGTDDSSRNKGGNAPLHLASIGGHLEVARFLLDRGTDQNARNKNDITPLHLASARGHLEVARLLLDCGVDQNPREKNGDTPLHFALEGGHLQVAWLLLGHGADENARDKNGDTPLRLVLRKHMEEDKQTRTHLHTDSLRNSDNNTPSFSKPGRERFQAAEILPDHVTDAHAYPGQGPIYAMTDALNESPNVSGDETSREEVLELVEEGESDKTPLHVASQKGDSRIARLLLDRGAGVDARDNDSMTPLHWAVQEGQLKVTQLLLERHADANARDNRNWPPLHVALHSGRLAIVEILLDRGADINATDSYNWTALYKASAEGHADVVQVLLDRGAYTNVRDDNGCTPLHLASQEGHVNIARVLLEHQADPNSFDESHRSPLHWASQGGLKEAVQFLLRYGADKNTIDEENQTPLHLASRYGRLEVVQVLLQDEAGVNAKDKNQQTPLHLVSREERLQAPLHGAFPCMHLEVAQLLLNKGSEVNASDDEARTPLHSASQEGCLNIVRLLIEHGGNVNSQDNDNRTPLHLATGEGHLDVIRFLLGNGADVNCRDKGNGWTPLHIAAEEGDLEVVQVLLDHDADANALDNHDWNALHLASQGGHPELEELLLKYTTLRATEGTQVHKHEEREENEHKELMLD